jgi:polyferredoxin
MVIWVHLCELPAMQGGTGIMATFNKTKNQKCSYRLTDNIFS